MEPEDLLSSLGSSISSISSEEGGDDEDIPFVDVEATPMPTKRGPRRAFLQEEESDDDGGMGEDEDVFGDDPPSMTLKDILLSADTSNFDLLGESILSHFWRRS